MSTFVAIGYICVWTVMIVWMTRDIHRARLNRRWPKRELEGPGSIMDAIVVEYMARDPFDPTSTLTFIMDIEEMPFAGVTAHGTPTASKKAAASSSTYYADDPVIPYPGWQDGYSKAPVTELLYSKTYGRFTTEAEATALVHKLEVEKGLIAERKNRE